MEITRTEKLDPRHDVKIYREEVEEVGGLKIWKLVMEESFSTQDEEHRLVEGEDDLVYVREMRPGVVYYALDKEVKEATDRVGIFINDDLMTVFNSYEDEVWENNDDEDRIVPILRIDPDFVIVGDVRWSRAMGKYIHIFNKEQALEMCMRTDYKFVPYGSRERMRNNLRKAYTTYREALIEKNKTIRRYIRRNHALQKSRSRWYATFVVLLLAVVLGVTTLFACHSNPEDLFDFQAEPDYPYSPDGEYQEEDLSNPQTRESQEITITQDGE